MSQRTPEHYWLLESMCLEFLNEAGDRMSPAWLERWAIIMKENNFKLIATVLRTLLRRKEVLHD